MGQDEQDQVVERAGTGRALQHYLAQIVRHRRVAVPALLLAPAAQICLFYLPPLVLGRLLTELDGDTAPPAERLLPYVLLFGACWVLGEAFWRLAIHFLNRTGARGTGDLYTAGMDVLLHRDSAFFADHFAGALTKRVLGYASRFEQFIDTLVFDVAASVVPLVFAAVVLWRYDPRLVLVLLGMTVATVVLIAPLIRRRQRLVDAREAARARLSGQVADTLGNMDSVLVFAARDTESRAHRERVSQLQQLSLRSWDYGNLRIDVVVGVVSAVTNTVGLVLALSVGRDGVSPEAVLVTFSYYVQSTRLLFEFNRIYRNIETALTEAAQFTQLLDDHPVVLDPETPCPLEPADASVRFHGVGFVHSGRERALFSDFDLHVEAGERVGLVGPSGGGKTTLTRLLLRLTDVQAGRVLVGGLDVRSLRQEDLRSLIAYVPQDPVMFHRTLRDNIAFGRPGASDAAVHEAAEAAHVLEFSDDLPHGLDTLVGERGVKLSGGQRQRVALARAVLRDAPVLLLDEATSALDSGTEARIQQALGRLMQGRTTIAVAHRLGTVARMDRLVVLDQGRVVEQGPHDQLLAARGVYAGLWSRQAHLAEAPHLPTD